MTFRPGSYKRHRFPPEIIAQAVRLYFRFPLSLRLVEEMLLERGIVVFHETLRRWAIKVGPDYAHRLRRKALIRQNILHLDEAVISINGEKRLLWRAVLSIQLHRLKAMEEWNLPQPLPGKLAASVRLCARETVCDNAWSDTLTTVRRPVRDDREGTEPHLGID
jgi:hypothetical protein